MNADQILQAAADHMKDRAATYDKPDGERSMAATVEAFRAVTGDGLMNTEERGWLFMGMLKAVRSQQGAYRADCYEDGAAYVALAGEAAARERSGPVPACNVPPRWPDDESFRWRAQDANGNWYVFTHKPDPRGAGWYLPKGSVMCIACTSPNPDWRNTLGEHPSTFGQINTFDMRGNKEC